MKKTSLVIALASASLISLTPALAQGRGGGHGGGHGGGQGIGVGARGNAGLGISRNRVGGGIDTRARARANSRGPERAADRATGRANANSVLRARTGAEIDERDVRLDTGVETRARARTNSRGPERASPRALERANANSVLSGASRLRTDLGALAPGLTVRDASGATLGTISRVIRSSDGTVRNVLVQAQDRRRTIPLRPDSLSLSGDIVTTTGLRLDRDD